MTPEYQTFLAGKAARAPMRGLTVLPPIKDHLFPFQRHCVEFALRCGSAGIFLDTGLGKTAVELEWCRIAAEATTGRALILTPLAVARQIEAEGRRWGYDCRVIREQSEAGDGINICNYDRLDKLDPSMFGAVALDEASILKSFGGRTSRALIELFRDHTYRLAATATPAPNDHMELGQYAEFLGIMASNEMLTRWFISDQTEMGAYRLKGHAESDFWDWMASWARMAEKPADLGDTSVSFDLPPLNVFRHRAKETDLRGGEGLFATVEMSATRMHEVKRQTIDARADVVAGLVEAEAEETWVIWVDTDYEADAVKAALPSAIEVRGSQPIEAKEATLAAFAAGTARHLITKPSLTGFGLNWQHCARVAYVGRSFSYETYYQSVRRCWRFGQKRPVEVHLIVAEGEAEIGRVIDRKATGHASMKAAMRQAMIRAQGKISEVKVPYQPTHNGRLPKWLSAA